MTTPHPATREYRNTVVRLADLTVLDPVISDLRFEACQIIGPAVLVLMRDVHVQGCSFDAPDADSLIWRIPDSRQGVIGAVGLLRVEFFSCRFQGVGLGVRDEDYTSVTAGLGFPTT